MRLARLLRINEFLKKFEDKPWKFFISWFVYTWLCCMFAEWDMKLRISENYPNNIMQRIPPSEKSQPDNIFLPTFSLTFFWVQDQFFFLC